MGADMGVSCDVFEQWLGQPVVLQVLLGEYTVPIQGRILNTTGDLLRVTVDGNWDVEVPKSNVLAVEESQHAALVM
ncbi:MAG: hypothetical protein LAN71_12595 [Acidobacteriia bacterium]|nr:hypothetical protein [Terriglobia bacterium]